MPDQCAWAHISSCIDDSDCSFFHSRRSSTRSLTTLASGASLIDASAQAIPKVSVGNTICMHNAMYHQFLDGQQGVRLEEPSRVTVLKCSLDELTQLNRNLRHVEAGGPAACQTCGAADAQSQCAKCKTKYCGKVR